MAAVAMFAAAMAFSAFPLAALWASRGFSGYSTTILAMLLSQLVLLTITARSPRRRRLVARCLGHRRSLLVLTAAGCCLGGAYLAFAESVTRLDPALATVLLESHLVLVVFIGPVAVPRLSSSRTDGHKSAMAVVAFVALVALSVPGSSVDVSPVGVTLAVASSALLVANIVLRQRACDQIRSVVPDVSEFDLSVVANLVSRAVPAALTVFVLSDLWALVTFADPRASIAVISIGVIVLTLNNVLYLMAVNSSPVSTINALRYCAPAMATVWLYLLGEVETISAAVGGGLSILLAASFFTVLDPRRELVVTAVVIGAIASGAVLTTTTAVPGPAVGVLAVASLGAGLVAWPFRNVGSRQTSVVHDDYQRIIRWMLAPLVIGLQVLIVP